MTADLTREKIERLRVDFDRGHDLGYGDQRALLAHALAEPARLAAARAEGVREGIEMAARWHDDKVRPMRLIGAMVLADNHAASAINIRALSPAPASWTPTHRHYKGALYREIMRCEAADGDKLVPIVIYENKAGRRFARNAARFDGVVKTPGRDFAIQTVRRFEPINPTPAEAPTALTRCQAASLRNDGECSHPLCPVPHGSKGVDRLVCTLPGAGDDYVDEDDLPPAEAPTTPTAEASDGWIEWKGGECPVEAETIVETRYRNGDGDDARPARRFGWDHWGGEKGDWDIIAYRIVQPAPSAPVAEGE